MHLYFLNKVAGKLEVKSTSCLKQGNFAFFASNSNKHSLKALHLLCVVFLTHLPCAVVTLWVAPKIK